MSPISCNAELRDSRQLLGRSYFKIKTKKKLLKCQTFFSEIMSGIKVNYDFDFLLNI